MSKANIMSIQDSFENHLGEYAAEAVAIVALAGVAYFAITSYVNYLKSHPLSANATSYGIATSNPISQLGSDLSIASGVDTTAQNQLNANNYIKAPINYNTTNPSFASDIYQSLQNNNSGIINVTPTGIGTYGGNLSTTIYNEDKTGSQTGNWALGSMGNPYNASKGWQGTGYYTGLNSAPKLTQYISDMFSFMMWNG